MGVDLEKGGMTPLPIIQLIGFLCLMKSGLQKGVNDVLKQRKVNLNERIASFTKEVTSF